MIGNCSPLLSSVFGILLFNEMHRAPRRAWLAFVAVVVLYLLALLLVVLATQ